MKNIFALIYVWILLTSSAFAFDSIEIHGEKSTADYWTSKNTSGEFTLLTDAEISSLNERIALHDLKSYADKISSNEVRAKILSCLTEFSQVDSIENNCDFENVTGEILYAVTSKQSEIRSLPDSAEKFKIVDPLTSMIVFAKSRDAKFYFIESNNLTGWINADAVSFTDKDTWLEFLEPKDFLVVTANKKSIQIGSSFVIEFRMGSKIPLETIELKNGKYKATVIFDVNQHLNKIPVSINDDDSINLGFLNCTENNLIRQAFRYLGDDEVDSYELTSNIYRTVGVELPRDYRQEKSLPVQIRLTGTENYDRLQRIFFARTGSIIYTPGHAMIYIGRDLNSPIVIHAVDKYFTFDSGIREENSVNRVIISTMNFQNQHGITSLNSSTSINELKK